MKGEIAMTLVRWSPNRMHTGWYPVSNLATEIVSMQREIDRLFDRFQGGITERNGTATFMPAVDIVEREKDYLVRVELPGLDRNDVKISVLDDVLTIRGERKAEEERKDEQIHRLERSHGVFERSFTLPNSIKSEQIEATFENGLLSITLPKLEQPKPKPIEIKIK